MEQITAKFLERVKYQSKTNFSRSEVVVRLNINYAEKTFDIKPYISTNDKFTFDDCRDPEKWKAVCDAIRSAVEFAENELYGAKPAKQ